MKTHGATGINLVGYASANFSLGNTMRHIAYALIRRGVPIRVFDVDHGRHFQGHDDSLAAYTVADLRCLPHDINLICLPLSGLEDWIEALDEQALCWHDRLNVFVVFWEVPVLPPQWAIALEAFDVLLCGSWFVRELVATQVRRAVPIHFNYPLSMPEIPLVSRHTYGVPDDAFAFYFSFDPLSGLERKNPQAVLAAFRQASLGYPHAHLVIKLNIPADRVEDLPIQTKEFLDACRQTPGVTLVTRSLTYSDALGLCQSCNCFISLHRAEGLGMAPMEAMLMGKPTVLTAWSGTMSYASADSSCLVPYDLVIPTEHPSFRASFLGAHTAWAEPQVDAAVYWMQRLMSDTLFRNNKALTGQQKMMSYVAEAMECSFMDELLQMTEIKCGGGLPGTDLFDIKARVRRAAFKAGLRTSPVWTILMRYFPKFWRLVSWWRQRKVT